MGTERQFRKMGKMEMDGGDGRVTTRMYLMPLNCTRRNG